MITQRELAMALYGAARLARFDPSGLAAFDDSAAGFWRSFWAAAIIAPAFALLLALRYQAGFEDGPGGGTVGVHPVRFALIEGVAYAVAWLAFPAVMVGVSRRIGRWHRFTRYLVAYNWSAIIQNAIYLPVAMLTVAGALPEGLGGLLGLAALIYILLYRWFIARTALDVGGGTAAAVVAIDFALGIAINGIADGRLAAAMNAG